MAMLLRRTVILLALALPAAAVAAVLSPPILLAPADGATVRTSHPAFRWRLPAGRRSEAIYVTQSPLTTAQGSPAGDVVERVVLRESDVRWRPTRPLPAGRYWWTVAARARQTSARAFSRPWTFLIPVRLRVLSIDSGRSGRSVVVRWTGNVERATVRLRVISAGRVLWTAARTETSRRLGSVVRTTFTLPTRVAAVPGRATFRVAVTARA